MATTPTHSASSHPVKCEITGKELVAAAKTLKPGIPKKKQEPLVSLVIKGVDGGLEFSLPGVTVMAEATVTARFHLIVPWVMFKLAMTAPRKPTSIVQLEFSENCISVDGIATRSNQIDFRLESAAEPTRVAVVADTDPKSTELPTAPQVVKEVQETTHTDPFEIPLGLPLLEAWVYMRRFGVQRFLVNEAFSAQLIQLDNLLDKVAKLLAPTGITREDLEKLLDRNAGIKTDNTKASSGENEVH